MSEELEKLQKLGAQKIYEQTHIPVQNVQALLHSSFDSFSRVQFLGFISILEREYKIELASLKTEGLAFFDNKTESQEVEGIFIAPKSSKKSNFLYAGIAIIIVLLAIVLSLSSPDDKEIPEQQPDDSLIETVQKNIEPKKEIVVPLVLVTDVNNSEKVEEKIALEVIAPTIIKPKSFEIVAKSKVWFGYIDVDTNKKYQKTFKGSKELDPTKTWLLMFGHGYINMFVDYKVVKFDSRNYVRFLYKNGKITHITKNEFKKLNRGRAW